MDDEFRPGTNGLRVHYAERSLFNAFYPGYDAIFSFFTLFTPGFSNFSPNSHFFPCSYLILHNLYVWVDPKHLTPTICLSGYMMTMNADVSNKPATKNLHLTDGQDSYIKVRQLIEGSWEGSSPRYRHRILEFRILSTFFSIRVGDTVDLMVLRREVQNGPPVKVTAGLRRNTVCPRSSDPFYIVTYYIKLDHYFLDILYREVERSVHRDGNN